MTICDARGKPLCVNDLVMIHHSSDPNVYRVIRIEDHRKMKYARLETVELNRVGYQITYTAVHCLQRAEPEDLL